SHTQDRAPVLSRRRLAAHLRAEQQVELRYAVVRLGGGAIGQRTLDVPDTGPGGSAGHVDPARVVGQGEHVTRLDLQAHGEHVQARVVDQLGRARAHELELPVTDRAQDPQLDVAVDAAGVHREV